MRLPNLLIVGAQKAGTTSLYEYLAQHPDIYMCPVKEPHYFCDVGPRVAASAAEYAALFQGWGEQRIGGEASVTYLHHPGAAAAIRAAAPEARIVILLRQPADRAYSAWSMLRFQLGYEPLDFTAALDAEDARVAEGLAPGRLPFYRGFFHYRRQGLYAGMVEGFLSRFPRDQIRIYLFEELAANPGAVCRDLFGWLGVDADFVPDTVPHNAASALRNARLHRLLLEPPAWVMRTYERLPARLRLAVYAIGRKAYQLNSRRHRAPAIDPVIRRELTESYRADCRKLEALIGRDLSGWFEGVGSDAQQ